MVSEKRRATYQPLAEERGLDDLVHANRFSEFSVQPGLFKHVAAGCRRGDFFDVILRVSGIDDATRNIRIRSNKKALASCRGLSGYLGGCEEKSCRTLSV